MRMLTRYIGFSDTKIQAQDVLTAKRILVSRPNSRLGNQLLITPLVEELAALFPGCKIDLFVRGFVSTIIFENYPETGRTIHLPKKPFRELWQYIKVWWSIRDVKYDLVINATEGSSSGRLSTRFARARCRFYNNTDPDLAARYADYLHIAKFPVYNLRRFISRSGMNVPERPVGTLSLRLSEAELSNGKQVLDSYVDPAKPTISIYTFATGMKLYSKGWWAVMYDALTEAFGSTCNILEVLPVENRSQIDFAAPAYYSKDIREIASVIANTAIFLGADSGIMHLAAASGTPVVGLFSVTDSSIYEPYGNHSVAVHTQTTDAEGIVGVMKNILDKCRKSEG